MRLSRRGFLCAAACAPLAGIASAAADAASSTQSLKVRESKQHCLLLNFSCVLPESFEGYRESLRDAGIVTVASQRTDAAYLVVAPAASLIRFPEEARFIKRSAEAGAIVLVESGGGFLPPAEFERHAALVRAEFGLTLRPPVNLWIQANGRIPYLDFTWPSGKRVRDFSRAVPVRADGRQEEDVVTIATVAGQAASVRKRAGAGTVIFLGSPIGPHLLAGDREAHDWISDLKRVARAEPKT